MDCAECGSSGYAISGDLNMLDKLLMTTDVRYIIVVEKVIVCHNCASVNILQWHPSFQSTVFLSFAARNIPAVG